MKQLPDETYEQWIERARIFELNNARKNLKKGVAIEEVLETLANKLIQKAIHPLLTAAKSVETNYDVEESKRRYEEAYLKKNKPVADHINQKD